MIVSLNVRLEGSTLEIAKGLHRIGSDIVNSYLVVNGGSVTLTDAGLPRYWKLLNSELARFGVALGDGRAPILTHGDTEGVRLVREAAARRG